MLLETDLPRDSAGNLRKIIVFTEHSDTLNYLVDHIRTAAWSSRTRLSPSTVAYAARSVRKTQQLFTQDKDVRVLVATDAAGEGLNLQRAPSDGQLRPAMEPNRIEQRFGRIHRIGQDEVCHLGTSSRPTHARVTCSCGSWRRLDEQRKAYSPARSSMSWASAFEDQPLRDPASRRHPLRRPA